MSSVPRAWARAAAVAAAAAALVVGAACAHTPTDKMRESARISYDMGVQNFERGEQREALRALLAAVRDDPDLAEAHHALGLVLHAMGQPVDALAHYERAVALNPQFSDAFNNMGILLLDTGRYREAIAAFERALGNILYSTPYLAEGNLGWAQYRAGNTAAARTHIGNAVAAEPQFCRGYEWLARIALDQDEPREVVAQGQRFKRHCLDDAHVAQGIAPDYRREMQYYLAIGHLKQGQRELARQLLAQCAVYDAEARGYAAKCAQSLSALR